MLDIPIHAKVLCAGDHPCGHTSYVVINPATKTMTHVVVKRGGWPQDERLVPVELVPKSTLEHIRLSCSKDELAKMDTFIETEFIESEVDQYLADPYIVIVGMTGDGVNDAPALKKADVGIAVSGATDAARAAADIVLLTPGLSVIIDALQESRRIFQRINSYAIYRITETTRVLFFMTLSILVFNFYPVTAVMIVLLALLNDGAILTIAYDHVEDSDRPEKWNLPVVLGVATLLGIAGVFASFGLFYLGERIFKLDQDFIQSLMYLTLSVAGHLTILVTRTRKPFWSFRPSFKLLGAALVTQMVATLITVYGVLMTPIGWTWAGFVWGYALIWLLVNDQVKLAAYGIFDDLQSSLLNHHHA